VLLLIFNRPDLTEQVMEQIRKAQPPQLFVGADGPRADRPDDSENCEEAREVATDVEWDCEVHTLFREENLGCKQAVSSAITWFFEHVEAGIILEDDCVPHSTFFPYCADLLQRYRHDERVMTISGDNFQPAERTYDASYYFSVYNHVWGWATWRRAWQHYEGNIPAWDSLKGTGWLEGWLGTEEEARYWESIFDRVAREEIDSWAYPWTFSCWREHGLTILPATNLVSNIGFDERSTHTASEESDAARLPVDPLSFPLRHPSGMVRDYEADRFTSEHHFGISDSKLSRWRQLVSKIYPDLLNRTKNCGLLGNKIFNKT
jgi:hypothetical protein